MAVMVPLSLVVKESEVAGAERPFLARNWPHRIGSLEERRSASGMGAGEDRVQKKRRWAVGRATSFLGSALMCCFVVFLLAAGLLGVGVLAASA